MIWMLTMAMAAPVFTGNVETDFDIDGAIMVADPSGVDVGMPTMYPAARISGLDLRGLHLFYEQSTDTLYVGLDSYGAAGDVDGDGDPNDTGPVLDSLGGIDLPNWGGSESFALMIDADQDGVVDLIVGVPAGDDLGAFGAYTFAGPVIAPGLSFETWQPLHAGTLHAPPDGDVEFTVPNLSQVAGFWGPTMDVAAFQGSLSDAGIGEDFVPGVLDFATVDLATPTLMVTGTCPGPVQIDVTGVHAGESLSLYWSRQPGSAPIPWGRCAGTPTGLGVRGMFLFGGTADGAGTFTTPASLPRSACGRTIQVLARNSCEVTEAVTL